MKAFKSKRLTVNMGHYESVALSASLEIDSEVDRDALDALGLDPWDTDEVTHFLDQQLDKLLADGVEEASDFTDEPDSFIHLYHEDKSKRSSK